MFAPLELATALIERDGCLLIVAARYPNLAEPLWQLPGGRRRNGEPFEAALKREVREETGLDAGIDALAFVSESFDHAGKVHVLNLTFTARAAGDVIVPSHDAHVIDAAWVARDEALARMRVPAVREPIAAFLRGDARRYYRFADSGISIVFADEA